MIKVYKTSGKGQVFLKAALAGMDARRVDNMLIITAPPGFLFYNGQKTLRYAGEQGVWASVYGHAYTDIMQPLVAEV